MNLYYENTFMQKTVESRREKRREERELERNARFGEIADYDVTR